MLKKQAENLRRSKGVDFINYVRVQCMTDIIMDESDQKTIASLLETG